MNPGPLTFDLDIPTVDRGHRLAGDGGNMQHLFDCLALQGVLGKRLWTSGRDLGGSLDTFWGAWGHLGTSGVGLGDSLDTIWGVWGHLGEVLRQSGCLRDILEAPRGMAREKMITHDDPR